MMTVILSCTVHKWDIGSVHYCHELEDYWGEILCCLPGILAEKLGIGWSCVSIGQAGKRLENLLGTPAN
jgi:hypothetical protein